MSYSNDQRRDYRRNDDGDGQSRNYGRRNDGYQRRDNDREDRGFQRNRDGGQFSEKMEVESNQVGAIIGRGGSNIRDIQSKFSVHINVDKYSNENGMNSVSISGDSQKDIDDALDHIKTQVEESQQRGGGQRYDRGDRSRNNY